MENVIFKGIESSCVRRGEMGPAPSPPIVPLPAKSSWTNSFIIMCHRTQIKHARVPGAVVISTSAPETRSSGNDQCSRNDITAADRARCGRRSRNLKGKKKKEEKGKQMTRKSTEETEMWTKNERQLCREKTGVEGVIRAPAGRRGGWLERRAGI